MRLEKCVLRVGWVRTAKGRCDKLVVAIGSSLPEVEGRLAAKVNAHNARHVARGDEFCGVGVACITLFDVGAAFLERIAPGV